mmetsp:Transcript_16162/g.45028  ORF Transcript_16162/g.45028 Transcript_16162/m.45028 type:complete len:139 (+) Transcript_16162:66-482(+)|eukprot:CAMPEP_0117670988 /NCGR_PEP_ID=MMETSP0804-20121206/13078_1 /TAXON_ID=1074897 /ORGANISM="Tetraselmis astigmatica, Strain CCMP880" /LENGTH=138 /DNA_ID=CAMNT_0005479387 /DNA_START=162 /DNA_END=578 /DNA_ORIENTATION=-
MANPHQEDLNAFLSFSFQKKKPNQTNAEQPAEMEVERSSHTWTSGVEARNVGALDIDPHALLYGQYKRECRRWSSTSDGSDGSFGSVDTYDHPLSTVNESIDASLPSKPTHRRATVTHDGRRVGQQTKMDWSSRKFLM